MIRTTEQWKTDTLAAVRGMSNRLLVHQLMFFGLDYTDRIAQAERKMIAEELCNRLRATGFIDPSDNLGKPR